MARAKKLAEALARKNPEKFSMMAFAARCWKCGKNRMLEARNRVIVARNTCDCEDTVDQQCARCLVQGGHFINCPVLAKPPQ
jgi:hypothetical protein